MHKKKKNKEIKSWRKRHKLSNKTHEIINEHPRFRYSTSEKLFLIFRKFILKLKNVQLIFINFLLFNDNSGNRLLEIF